MLRGKIIIRFIDALNAFVQKFEKWTRKAEMGSFAIFATLSTVGSDDVDDALSSEILEHITSLRKAFLRYFPEILESDLKLARKPFAVSGEEVRDDSQDELIDHKNDSTRRVMFDTLPICEFWEKMCTSYSRVTKEYIIKLLPL